MDLKLACRELNSAYLLVQEDKNRIVGWLGAMAQSDDAFPDVTLIKSDLSTAIKNI